MNIGRILANAFARRVAYVVVAVALAWLGLGSARAQTACNDVLTYNTSSSSAPVCPSEAAAKAAATASAQYKVDNYTGTKSMGGTAQGANATHGWFRQTYTAAGTRDEYRRWLLNPTCPTGQFWNTSTGSCTPNCTGRPSEVFTSQGRIPVGSHGCKNGCQFAVHGNGDGTYSRMFGSNTNTCNVIPECQAGEYLFAATGLCHVPEPQCTANQTKNPVTGECEDACPAGMTPDADGLCKPSEDTCPAGMIRSPSGQCLPGEGQCAAGEARRPNGTCGRDADGDGTADEDDEDPENDPEEFFAGGDSCNAPPSCAGGIIDCGMARIQWRIDCNTRRNVNITGGACSAMPVCVGENCKAMEYAQLLQQWRATCALEKLAGREAGEGGNVGDANNNGVADVLEGSFTPSNGGTGDVETGVSTKTVGTSLLNTENIFGGGSCPQPPTFQIMGFTVSGADFPHWCNAMLILRGCILIFGAFTAVKILMGWGF